MILIDKTFFKPTRISRTLAMLENLHADSNQSQNKLGTRCGLSSAMSNKYLKELQSDGLVTAHPINGKSFSYELTPRGEQQRQNMLGEYSAEIVQIYSALKEMVRKKLKSLADENARTVVLFGASETCEVVLSALKNTPFRIIALVDNDPAKQGQIFNGHVVSPPAVLENLEFQAVIVTSFARQQEITKQLQLLQNSKRFEIIGL